MGSFAEATSGGINFTGYGVDGYKTRAFPVPDAPNPAPNEDGEVLPGKTNIGYGLTPENKKRLGEILVEAAEYTKNVYGHVLAAGANRQTQKITKGQPVDSSVLYNPSSNTALQISNAISNNRQIIIIAIAAVIFVVVLMKAKGG